MVNENTGHNYSLGTEAAVIEKLENLLRCLVGDYTDVETAEASIMGFEVVSKGREEYTVEGVKIFSIINS